MICPYCRSSVHCRVMPGSDQLVHALCLVAYCVNPECREMAYKRLVCAQDLVSKWDKIERPEELN